MYSYKYSKRDVRHKCGSLWSYEDNSSTPSMTSSAVLMRSCSGFLHRFSSRLKLQTQITTDDQKERLFSDNNDCNDYVMISDYSLVISDLLIALIIIYIAYYS